MSNYARLFALIGPAKLKDIIFTARLIEANEMLACGLLTELTADEESLLTRAQQQAEQIASHAPLTLTATKEALRRIRNQVIPDEADSDLIVMCYLSQDFREGVEAFLSKRSPEWRGE